MSMPRNLRQTLLLGNVFLFALATTSGMDLCPKVVKASCNLVPNPSLPTSSIRGEILLRQRITCHRQYPVEIKIRIAGMVADGKTTFHGFHVHQSGDLSGGCESMGGHYNPFGTNHGDQCDPVWYYVFETCHAATCRRLGKRARGRVKAFKYDSIATLVGETSILGRGIVLHEMKDDLRTGGDQGSITTGNAGRRLACCTIQPV